MARAPRTKPETQTAAPPEPLRATLVDKDEPTDRREPVQALAIVDANPHTSLQMAIDRGMSADTIDRLIAAAERWDDLQEKKRLREAEQAFVVAMTEFKSDPPQIVKRSVVDFTSAKGRTNYNYANLADVVDAVVRGMAKVGLSHRWKPEQSAEGIRVTCIVQHALGHAESITLGPVKADESGNKNPIQGIASAITYLERYSLLSICGLATAESDDDGGDPLPPEETPEQKAARETRQAEEAAAKAIEDGWFDKLGLCQSVDELRKLKAEMVTFYGVNEKVPQPLITRYNARLGALKTKDA